MSKTSPTRRSKEKLTDAGWTCAITERWNPFAGEHGIRQDLFGFIDMLAISGGTWHSGILAVQTTSGANVAARVAKILAEPRAKVWLESGGRIVVHGWRKLKVKRGGKAMRWECREVFVTLDMFESKAAA